MAAVRPILRGWGRLRVTGAEALPPSGAVLLLANHDSAWDPLVIAAAARKRRQIRALARSSLWQYRVLGRVLDAMGQIPITRGQGDANAIGRAVAELAAGACIGVFPEGTVSRGRRLRARSGAGRLALAVPEAHLVCAAVTGTVDIARFPRRPRLRVCFFTPTEGAFRPGESARMSSPRGSWPTSGSGPPFLFPGETTAEGPALLPAAALFVLIGAEPRAAWLAGTVAATVNGGRKLTP